MPITDNELVNDEPLDSFQHVPLPIGDYFLDRITRNIEKFGDGPWMHDSSTGKSMTYSEMVTGVTSMASALRKRGLGVGDIVLLMAPNFIEVALTFLGVWKAGGVCACLTLNLFAEDIRKRATDLRAKFILTDEARAKTVLQAVKDLDFVEEVFVVGQAEGCTSVYELLQDDGKDCPERSDIDLDSLAWLMFSSGTTGTPKGIVHTHANITSMLASRKTASPGLKLLFINYMVNSGGNTMFLIFTAFHSSITVISDFHDENLLKAIDETKPFWVSCFPSQLASICRHPNLDQFDLSSVVFISCTGSGIYPKYERDIFDRVPNLLALNTAYGMSETSLIASNTKKPAELFKLSREQIIQSHIIGSVGNVMPYVKVKIVDEHTGVKLGPNGIGEICVHSPFTMKEYMNNPKATAETIQDGWLHTGDKGYYDEKENLFIIGRFKELIKYRMAHVVPTNIEKQMMTHPAVEEVGVVGQPDEVDGELPTAFVVLRKGHSATAEELIDFTNELVIDEEKLRGGVRFIDKVPRNELGKIMRPQLMKLL